MDGICRHQDNHAYRKGALRELFEESGILLARQNAKSRQLVSVPQATRQVGRKLVHSGKVPFQVWLNQQSPSAVLDTDGLIPFSHWITPPNLSRRFTTQMYLYVLPTDDSAEVTSAGERGPQHEETAVNMTPLELKQTSTDFIPTPDGNLENTAATFSSAHVWLSLARVGSIILFPPQYLLLHLISHFVDNESTPPAQRIEQLIDFIHRQQGADNVSWAEKCISPHTLAMQSVRPDGKVVLGLDKPGVEVEQLGLTSRVRGDSERVVLVKWSKEGPRELEVRWKREIMEESKSNTQTSNGNVRDPVRERGIKL